MDGYQGNIALMTQNLHNIADILREDHRRKLGASFVQQGDYTPEGVMSFAQKNNLSPAEMAGVVQTAGAFNHFKRGYDPLVQVSSTDDQGNQYVESVPESSTVGKKFMTKAGDTVPYYDLTTGEGGMFPSNQAPPPGWGTEGMLKSLMDQQGRMDATRYREGQENDRAANRVQAQRDIAAQRSPGEQVDGKIKGFEKQRDFYAAKAEFGDEAAARKADEYNAMIEEAIGVQTPGNNSTGNQTRPQIELTGGVEVDMPDIGRAIKFTGPGGKTYYQQQSTGKMFMDEQPGNEKANRPAPRSSAPASTKTASVSKPPSEPAPVDLLTGVVNQASQYQAPNLNDAGLRQLGRAAGAVADAGRWAGNVAMTPFRAAADAITAPQRANTEQFKANAVNAVSGLLSGKQPETGLEKMLTAQAADLASRKNISLQDALTEIINKL